MSIYYVLEKIDFAVKLERLLYNVLLIIIITLETMNLYLISLKRKKNLTFKLLELEMIFSIFQIFNWLSEE